VKGAAVDLKFGFGFGDVFYFFEARDDFADGIADMGGVLEGGPVDGLAC